MKLRADYTRYFLAYMTILFYSLCIPSSQYIPVGIALTALICFITKVSSVDATVFTVVLFAGAYFALESFMKYSLMNRVIFGITIICLYFLGFNWIRVIRGNVSDKFDLEKSLSKSLNLIYYGFAFYLISSFAFTVISGKIINSFSRDFYVIWNGGYGNPTHYETISCIPLGFGIYHLLAYKGRKSRLVDVIILSLILVANAMMSNRATFVCFLLFVGMSVVLNNIGKSFSRSTRITLETITIILVLYLIWDNNIFGIQDFASNIPVIQRINHLNLHGYEDPRIERQIYIITHFFDHTSGGGYFNNLIGECHNVWLDVYDYAGLIPFVLFVILSVDVIWSALKLLKANRCKEIIVLVASMFVAFLFEPVIRSVPNLFILYFFAVGLIRYLSSQKYPRENDPI